MRKLTRREITLLYILACLIIMLFGWMVIAKPALEKANKVKTEEATASVSLQNLKANQSMVDDLEKEAQKLGVDLMGLVHHFAVVQANEAIDKQLTTLAQKYYLKPLELSIHDRKRVSVVSLNKRLELLSKDEEIKNGTDGKIKGTQCDVVYVTLKTSGEQVQAAALAQEVSTYPTMRLNSMSIDNVNGEISFEFAIYLMPLEDQ